MRELLTVAGREVAVTTPAPRHVWEQLLAADPFALVTQSPRWLDALCRLRGFEDSSTLYEREDGRRVVLPMVRRRGADGRLAVQSSFGEGWGMGGPLAAGGTTVDDLELLTASLLARPALRTQIRPNPLLAAEWSAAVSPSVRSLPRLAHVIDLSGGFEHVWISRFKKKTRAAVRRAEKAGITVERGSSPEHVAAFYALFEQALPRWAQRQHEPLWLSRLRAHRRDPLRKFQLLAEMLGEQFGIWLARRDGRPVAAMIVLRGTNAHDTRGAMDRDAVRSSGANYLLQAAAIRDACEAGCRMYHFGDTGRSRSLAFYKTRFGAEAYPYAEYRFERLPITMVDRAARAGVKRAIGFVEPD